MKTNPSQALSTYWHYRIKAQPKECFRNAVMVVSTVNGGWRYVEGWAAIPSLDYIPMEHAWAETVSGEVVDPTWAIGLEPGTVYFESASWSRGDVSLLVARDHNVVLPLIAHKNDHGLRYHHTQEVYRAILEYTENIRSRPEQERDTVGEYIQGLAKPSRKRRKNPARRQRKTKERKPRAQQPEPEYPEYEPGTLVMIRFMEKVYKAVVVERSKLVKGAYSVLRVGGDRNVETCHPKFMRRLATPASPGDDSQS